MFKTNIFNTKILSTKKIRRVVFPKKKVLKNISVKTFKNIVLKIFNLKKDKKTALEILRVKKFNKYCVKIYKKTVLKSLVVFFF